MSDDIPSRQPIDSLDKIMQNWRLLIDCRQLAGALNADGIGDIKNRLRILDISRAAVYRQVHVPGAIWVNPTDLMLKNKSPNDDAAGRLPDPMQLQHWLDSLAISPQHRVVVYDDEGGAWAGRAIWNLHCCGFEQVHLLDGGIHAWLAAGLPTVSEPPARAEITKKFQVNPNAAQQWQIGFDELLPQVQQRTLQLWDCRSREEYDGVRLAARRGGHIVGAQWYEWTAVIDRDNALKLYPLDRIEADLNAVGIDGSLPLVVYCQAHHRSGLAYIVARLLGWSVRAYDGAWSEWGNRPDSLIANRMDNQ